MEALVRIGALFTTVLIMTPPTMVNNTTRPMTINSAVWPLSEREPRAATG
jgi:hypothetical protein